MIIFANAYLLKLYNKGIIVGVIYRPPNGDINLFGDYIENIFNKFNVPNKSVYIMGDFNINLHNIDSSPIATDFLETRTCIIFILSYYLQSNKNNLLFYNPN